MELEWNENRKFKKRIERKIKSNHISTSTSIKYAILRFIISDESSLNVSFKIVFH